MNGQIYSEFGLACGLGAAGMSYAHQYLPGTFYEVTRRCVDRAHKFTPNYDRGGKYASSVEQLYKYATARYAERRL